MDIFWIILISTSLLIFCSYATYKRGYDKGYKDGGQLVVNAWKRHLEEVRNSED